jgi:D-galactarolactone cycloisomerase
MRPCVARVESFPLEAPLPDGGYGASTVRLPARIATLVKITTSDGAVGWGESFGPPRVLASLLAELTGQLIGQPVDVREPFLLQNLQLGYHRTSGGLHVAALSGVDIALWDAYARTLGVPVSRLLGGQLRDRIPAYASTGYVTATRDPGEFRDQIARAVAEGFTGAKIKVGTGLAEDVARTEITRELLGPDGLLMVDYNANATVDTVRRSLARLRELDLYWVEEPLPPHDAAGWALLRDLGVPVAAGEALYTRYGFRDVIAGHRVDIVQPDLTKCGGFTEAKLISQMAAAWNLRVSPHCWGTGVAQAATLQLLAALPVVPFGQTGAEPALLEFDRGHNPLREGVLVTPLSFADSSVDVPQGPGLGIEVDEDAVRGHELADYHLDSTR